MNAEAILAKYAGQIAERLERVGELQKTTMQSLVNEPYPPASSAGNPPHRRTGHLRESIQSSGAEIHGLTVSVTVSVPDEQVAYAKFLEHGTNRMSARPFFTPAIEMTKPQVRVILVGDTL